MSPEEMMHKVHRKIDTCFAQGMKLEEVLEAIQEYIASFES